MSDLQTLTEELRNRLEGASTGRSVASLDDLHSIARDRDVAGGKRAKRKSPRKLRRGRS